jgi:hypothetical protein
MKKFVLLCLMMMVVGLIGFDVQADEYTNYQEIYFDDGDVMLLKEFDASDYNSYYKKVKKRKMFGWRIYVAHKNEHLEFIANTKIKIYNTGTTPISYEIDLEKEEETTNQITATGEIKIKGSGSKKTFKGSVDASIKASVTTSTTETSKESYQFKIDVDPMSYVSIVTRGTGEINNGVGSYYFFWARTKRGGWETFTMMTEYYEIVKARF